MWLDFFLPSARSCLLFWKSKLSKSNFTRFYCMLTILDQFPCHMGVPCVAFYYIDLSLLVPLKTEFEIPYKLFSLSFWYPDEIGSHSVVYLILGEESSFQRLSNLILVSQQNAEWGFKTEFKRLCSVTYTYHGVSSGLGIQSQESIVVWSKEPWSHWIFVIEVGTS